MKQKEIEMEKSQVLIATPLMEPLSDSLINQQMSTEAKVSKPCPWGSVKKNETVSLNDVMSEQLASYLDEKENNKETICMENTQVCTEEKTDCNDDYLLAQMLQLEFDKEHDVILNIEESKFNKESKIKVSYSKYRCLPDYSFSSDEDSDEKEQHSKDHWHNIDEALRVSNSVTKNGVCKQGDVTTTKHDHIINGRRNVGKLMEFPTCVQTGDGGQFDMRLSNGIINDLWKHSKSVKKRMYRKRDEGDKSTAEKALDEKTHLILYKFINNSILESLTGCFSTGKEACVYHAWSGMPKEESPSSEFAIKVFKTSQNEFHNRQQYMVDVHRFQHNFNKQNPRKIIHMWAEKEMHNLHRMREANIPCPQVVCFKKHVLVMTFIGKDMLPAPKIKDVNLPIEDMTIIFEQVIEIMKSLYKNCKLVHADMSEYNLLWFNDQTWVIDVSQSVNITHPLAKEFLLRDCSNITTFFENKGVFNVPSAETLFFNICGEYPKSK